MVRPDLCFVHLSDIHFLEDPAQPQYGVRTAEIFERAIPRVNALRPDLILVGGDLTSDEKEASYRRAQAAFARLDAPVHAVMGNHDDRRAYRSVFRPDRPPGPEPLTDAFDAGPCRFVLLDSQIAGAVAGRMDAAQLAWLDAELAGRPGRPTVIVVHHPPLPIGVRWLDALGFLNGQELVRVLRRHPQVRAVLFGHIHQPRIWRYEGMVFASVPALAFQFSPTEQEATGRHITQAPPGFRVVRVWDGGRGEARFETALHSLDGRIAPDPPAANLPEYGP
jgi:3',5'-cyclic-AMP phosphodiesterase